MEALESDSLLRSNDIHADHHHHHETGLLPRITEGIIHGVEAIVETTGEIMEEMTEIAGNVQEAAHDVQEAIVEEIHHVQEALNEEIHKADEGDVFFLDMTLTRNLSILPGDRNLTEAVKETTDIITPDTTDITAVETMDSQDVEGMPIVKPEPVTGTPLSAYLVLISAVVALSCSGPLLDLQKGVSPSIKMVWLMAGTALLLSPMAIRSLIHDGMPHSSNTQWCTFSFAASSFAVMCVAFTTSLDYTSVGNAVILANSQLLLLLAGKFLVGAPLIFLEGAGALIAFTGAVPCSRDHSSTAAQASLDVASTGLTTLWGDCLAMILAIGGVFYLTFGKSLRSTMNVYVFMFSTMALG